jgi:putative heme uptake system protein
MGAGREGFGSEAAPLPPVTYLLIDGENLDSTLGGSVLGHRPSPEERPRWERVVQFAGATYGQPVKTLFFLNASSGSMPMPFVQALLAIGVRPIALSGPSTMKVVDVGIQRTLAAIVDRPGNVVLGSHDGDFEPQIASLLTGDRKVALLGFREFVSSKYADHVAAGLEIFDLEEDAQSFNQVLPRVRIIDIDQFDPVRFL